MDKLVTIGILLKIVKVFVQPCFNNYFCCSKFCIRRK